MRDTLVVQVTYGHGDLSCVEFHYYFWEALFALEHFVELSTSDEGHDEVEAQLGLEEVVHAYEEGVVAGEKDIFF